MTALQWFIAISVILGSLLAYYGWGMQRVVRKRDRGVADIHNLFAEQVRADRPGLELVEDPLEAKLAAEKARKA